jgi:hypothetical protein
MRRETDGSEGRSEWYHSAEEYESEGERKNKRINGKMGVEMVSVAGATYLTTAELSQEERATRRGRETEKTRRNALGREEREPRRQAVGREGGHQRTKER